jgi:hypothetical protein
MKGARKDALANLSVPYTAIAFRTESKAAKLGYRKIATRDSRAKLRMLTDSPELSAAKTG